MSRSFESSARTDNTEALRTHSHMSALAFECLLRAGQTRELDHSEKRQHFRHWLARTDKRTCDLSSDDLFTENPRYTLATVGTNAVSSGMNIAKRYKFDTFGEEFSYEEPMGVVRKNGQYNRKQEIDRLVGYFSLILPKGEVLPGTHRSDFDEFIGNFMVAHSYDLHDDNFVRPRRYIEQIAKVGPEETALFDDTVDMLLMDKRPGDPFSVSNSIIRKALEEIRGNGLPGWLTDRNK